MLQEELYHSSGTSYEGGPSWKEAWPCPLDTHQLCHLKHDSGIFASIVPDPALMHCNLPSVFGLASWIWSHMWTCATSFGNLDNLGRWRQADSNPAPRACSPCAGMMSYPNSHQPTTVWYESSVIFMLNPSPSTGHISALRCRLLEILGALRSSQWLIFNK